MSAIRVSVHRTDASVHVIFGVHYLETMIMRNGRSRCKLARRNFIYTYRRKEANHTSVPVQYLLYPEVDRNLPGELLFLGAKDMTFRCWYLCGNWVVLLQRLGSSNCLTSQWCRRKLLLIISPEVAPPRTHPNVMNKHQSDYGDFFYKFIYYSDWLPVARVFGLINFTTVNILTLLR